jgi:hypothetical protein
MQSGVKPKAPQKNSMQGKMQMSPKDIADRSMYDQSKGKRKQGKAGDAQSVPSKAGDMPKERHRKANAKGAAVVPQTVAPPSVKGNPSQDLEKSFYDKALSRNEHESQQSKPSKMGRARPDKEARSKIPDGGASERPKHEMNRRHEMSSGKNSELASSEVPPPALPEPQKEKTGKNKISKASDAAAPAPAPADGTAKKSNKMTK